MTILNQEVGHTAGPCSKTARLRKKLIECKQERERTIEEYEKLFQETHQFYFAELESKEAASDKFGWMTCAYNLWIKNKHLETQLAEAGDAIAKASGGQS